MVQLPPGALTQKRYCAVPAQVAAPLRTMLVPGGCGDTWSVVSLAPLQALITSLMLATASYAARLLWSRTSTSRRYVPGARPAVCQLYVAAEPYGCTTVHVPPGGSTQKRYSGLGQLLVVAESVTTAPVPCGATGLVVSVGAPHGGSRVKAKRPTAS